jgi:hypothetical protein
MKVILLILLPLISSAQVDKMLHFSAGYIISTAATASLHHRGVRNSELWGIAAGFAAGILKELVDDRPDPADAYATMIGSVIGAAVISIPINEKNRHSKRIPVEF